jgi:hypothetical protein
MASKLRTRRHRHRAKAVLTFGINAVRKHKRKTGRTGGIWKKRTHGKHQPEAAE